MVGGRSQAERPRGSQRGWTRDSWTSKKMGSHLEALRLTLLASHKRTVYPIVLLGPCSLEGTQEGVYR